MLSHRFFIFSRPSHRSIASLAFNVYGSKNNCSTNPLVIGHGLFGQKSNWNSVAKQLQKRLDNQIYAIDFRNHGESEHTESMTYPEMVEDVVDFVKAEVLKDSKFDTIHFLGHSMGGKVAALLALTDGPSDLLKSVIIEDISPTSQSRNIHFRRYIEHMLKVDMTKSRREISDDLAHVITDVPTRQFLLTNLASDGDGSMKWKPNLETIGKHIEHVLRYTIDSGFFDKPSLLVYGEKSGYITENQFDDIKKLFPKMEFVSIKNAGHWVHAEQPAPFIDSIVNFIQKV